MGSVYKLQRITSDRVQGIGYGLDDPEFKFRQQQVINPSSETSRLAPEPNQLPVQRVMRALSREVKRQEHEVCHPLPSTVG